MVEHGTLDAEIQVRSLSSQPSKSSAIRSDLLAGKSYKEIQTSYCISKATVSYHASKIGLTVARPEYDWSKVQLDLMRGLTVAQLIEKYGFAKETFNRARKLGLVSPRNRPLRLLSLSELQQRYAEDVTKSHVRAHFRRKLIAEGIVDVKCAGCGADHWRGSKLTLEVHHIDGNPRNNLLDNFELLCPNCHSITPNWRGRNKRKKHAQ